MQDINIFFAGQDIDVTLLTLYAFFAFFAGLVIYLQRESKREGYPLEDDVSGKLEDPEGFLAYPKPKSFALASGEVIEKPNAVRDRDGLPLARTAAWSGSPFEPVGNPIGAGVGSGSYAMRADVVDVTGHGDPRIGPLSASPTFGIEEKDPDVRGFTMLGVDGETAGTVTDIWIDRMESLIRYLEVELPAEGDVPTSKVLIPMTMCEVKRKKGVITTDSLKAEQFRGAPYPAAPDRITRLEEEKVVGYFGSGYMYAEAERGEPAL